MGALKRKYRELKKSNPEKLIRLLALSYLLILFILFGTITIWLIDKFEANSQKNIDLITKQALDIKKEQLHSKTYTTVSLSQTILEEKEYEIKDSIKIKVENLHSIISQLYNEHKGDTKEKMIGEIKILLQNLESYDSSYSFLVSSKGVILLHPNSELINMQITKETSAEYTILQKGLEIINKSDSGYFIEKYYKPNTKTLVEKIYYLKYLAPLDIMIVNGQYRDEIEKTARDELIKILQNQQSNATQTYLSLFTLDSGELKSIHIERFPNKDSSFKLDYEIIRKQIEQGIAKGITRDFINKTTDDGSHMLTCYSATYTGDLIVANTILLDPILEKIKNEISNADDELSSEIIDILNMFIVFLFITAILSITIIRATKEIFLAKNTELKKKNDFLNLLMNTIDDMTIVYDKDYNVIEINSEALEFIGIDEKDKDKDIVKVELINFLKNILDKKDAKIEWVKNRHGEKRLIYCKKFKIEDGDNQLYTLFCKDITELHTLQSELQNSNEDIVRIFDNSTNPIVIIDRDGFVSYANNSFLAMSEYRKNDIKNINITSFIRKEFKKQFLSKLLKAGAVGFAEEFTAIISSKSATSIHTKISLTKFSKDSFVVMIRDITVELMHTQNLENMIQEEIYKNEETELKFSTLFDNAPAGILILDDKHQIVQTNKAFEVISGYSKDDLQDKKIENFFLDEYQEQIVNTLRSNLNEDSLKNSYEWKMIDNTGHTKYISILLQTIQRGKNSFKLMIASDVTELKISREKEKQQEKLLIQQSRFAVMGEMINMIAHQWRQPLGALSIEIINLVENYEAGSLDDKYVQKWESKSNSVLKHLSRTIDEFRTFFKQDKKKEIFHIDESINNTIELISATLKFKNIKVIKDLECGIEVFSFQNRLQQAFLNILNNAQDAIIDNDTEDGIINIVCKKDDDMVYISFEDSAGGIDVAPIAKIFEPYFSTKSKNSSGIGLYMTKVIIESHMGGELKVSNSKIGALFEIYLPILKKDDE